ncbi:MAG: UDP-N-acetylmuramoyl-L-alanine--D-glutamate ligase [Clostridia bacterium]|nr:UDP-N-acetylmuramoyl-L-alanine--D-glutamate ligase [Clostridia bacterium]
MYLKTNSFLVIGLKKSGFSISKLLLERGAKVYIYDDNVSEVVSKNIKELTTFGGIFVDNPIEILNLIDVLVLSPAVPIDNEIALLARKLQKRIVGELELASYFINSPVVAVTGTNGKTTVSSIISHVLKCANVNNVLVGNVGTPLSSKVSEIDENTVCVTEVSSYQLETVNRFCPHIAVILNVTPDHLERHYNMSNYLYLKGKILLNLKESEYAVLNYDDENVLNFTEKTKAKILWFSVKEKVNGAYLKDGFLNYDNQPIISVNELNILGIHNVENCLASICALKLLGIDNLIIKEGLKSFVGVKHRIQPIKTVNGVTFYIDSKSTNPDATVKAINTVKESTVLFLGGYEKGFSYNELMKEIKKSNNIIGVVITGMSAKTMYDSAISNGVENVSVISDFILAVKYAYGLASSGDAVLLSPATSSFDNFSDFEERGDKFIEIVSSL